MKLLAALFLAITALAITLLHEYREDKRTDLMLRPTVSVYGSDR